MKLKLKLKLKPKTNSMKKVIIVLALMLCTSVVLISCKGEKKENNETTEMQEDHAADKADIAMNMVY